MLRFKRVTLRDVVYYREAEFDLDRRGISIIMGLNRNADVAGRRNGAGKSLLMAAIPHLKYGDPAGLQKRISRHSLLDQKTSSITWEFSSAGSDWTVSKRRHGNSVRWSVLRDGEDQQPRTAAIAESIVSSIVPLNEEEFYTTVYLDSRRPSVLQTGSAAHRHSYFMDLFRLHDFETVKRYFTESLGELGSLRAKHEAYLEAAAPLAWVKRVDAGRLRRDLARVRRVKADLESRVERVGAAIEDRELADRYGDVLREADRYRRRALEQAEHALDQWREYRLGARARERAARERAALVSELERVADTLEIKIDAESVACDEHALARVRERVAAELRRARRAVSDHEHALDEYRRGQARLKRLALDRESSRKARRAARAATKPSRSAAAIVAERELLDARRRHLRSHRTDQCPTCGSALDLAQSRAELKRVSARVSELDLELEAAERYERAVSDAAQLWNDALETEYQALKNASSPEPDTRAALVLEALENVSLRAVVEVEDATPPAHSESAMTRVAERQRRYRDSYNAVRRVREAVDRGLAVTSSVADLRREREQLRARLETAIRDSVEIEKDLERYNADLETYRDLEGKIARIRRRLRDWPILESLTEAYGSKGLRVLVTRSLADRITENLNRYSELLFPEPFRFETAVDANQFDIIVTRRDGKSSDIRHLSGAESRSFALLWMISVLPLIPASQRSNIVILDEFEAGVDAVTRELIIERYLPALNTVVEHVIFITPHDIPPDSNRSVWVAVKSGDTTRLVPYAEV